MAEKGHEQARQSTIACLETLSGCGCDIRKVEGSSPASYYLGKREIEAEDAEVIADMLASSRYITQQQAQEITDRCCWSLSEHERSKIASSAVYVGERRTESDVDWSHNPRLIRRALENGEDVSFKYVDYNAQGLTVERHGGKTYVCAPLALLYVGGTYYLQATEDGVKDKTYRVDHMRNLTPVDSKINASKLRADLDIPKLTERTFSMYGARDGKDRDVELLVEPRSISSVVDYFKNRKSCNMRCNDIDGEHMSVTVTVQPSPTFFGWVAQYLGGVKIVAPDDIRRRFNEEVSKLIAE